MFVGGIHIDASLARLRSGVKSKTGHDRPIRMVDRHGPGEVPSDIDTGEARNMLGEVNTRERLKLLVGSGHSDQRGKWAF